MKETEATKILVVDDHRIVREGIVAMLAKNENVEVAAVATGQDAITHSREDRPDVVLMDVLMPGMNGIEAARWIKEMDASIRVIILSMEVSREYLTAAMRTGVDGYLPKDIGLEELLSAVNRVAKGEHVFHEAIGTLVLEDAYEKGKRNGRKALPNQLTKRENEVLSLVARRKTNNEIANLLGISVKTVETHKGHIFIKLGFNNSTEMIRYAMANRIVAVSH